MNLLNNYGTKENPKDRVLKILNRAKELCRHNPSCYQDCPYATYCFGPDMENIYIPIAWQLPDNLEPTTEIVSESELRNALNSIKNLSLEEKEKYHLWKC